MKHYKKPIQDDEIRLIGEEEYNTKKSIWKWLALALAILIAGGVL